MRKDVPSHDNEYQRNQKDRMSRIHCVIFLFVLLRLVKLFCDREMTTVPRAVGPTSGRRPVGNSVDSDYETYTNYTGLASVHASEAKIRGIAKVKPFPIHHVV